MTRKQIGAILGAIVLAVIAPLLVLAMLHGLDSWVSAQPTEQYPTFSIQDGGPSTPNGGGLLDPADILLYNAGGAPAVCIPCANLGLSGCTPLVGPDDPLDDLDALTYGADFGAYDSEVGYLGFSVDSGSTGQPGTAVNVESSCQPAEPEADEFTTQLDGNNFQFFDGDGTACGANAGTPLGLTEPSGDDLDAIDNKDCWAIDGIDPDGDGFLNRHAYFSLAPGSPTLPIINPPTGATPADVLVTIGVPMGPPWVYATEAQLGLQPGDDVNGLCLADMAMDDYFDPVGGGGSPDYLFYTLEKGSPSIPSVVPDAATIMYVPSPGVAVPVDLATALGLLADNTDDVDAMKCVKGLVDISIEEFTITLPEGTTAPPETDVTLSICEWSDFLMFEEKLYTGINEELSPASVTSQVGWAVIGSYPGQLNVRFNAKPGDICTDDTGAPVSCGEGGTAGVPWDPQSLPFSPPAGVDSCKDDIDNDNDGPTGGGCDIDGCTAFPGMGDPDCVDIYDVHFEIDLAWGTPTDVDREVQLHCKEGTAEESFDIQFENIEMPLGADDIDVDGVENNESYIDLTIICEAAGAEADKDVMAIIFDDADSYPGEGTQLDPSNEFTIQASENEAFSVTSVDYNFGPDEPADAEISFYANVPAGCSGRWLDEWATGLPDFPFDIQTIDGDYTVPSSGTTYFPSEKEPGPRWLDLHFQTLEYGLTEPVAIEDPGPNEGLCNDGIDNGDGGAGPCDFAPDACWPGSEPDPDCAVAANAQRYTRFFEIHCYEDADYVFEFCNRADVKSPDTDPDLTNNLRCATLTVHSQAPVEGCCLPNGTCQDLAPSVCMSQGGTPQGPASVCTVPEACCFGDGTCQAVDPLCCDDLGGTPLGQGSQCLGIEGCCDTIAGTCTDADAACCSYQGDIPQGPATACTVNQACCINGGAICTDCDVLCCDDLGGTLGGPVCLGDNPPQNGIDDACEAAEEVVKWMQPPDESEYGLDVSAYEPFVLAEDFQCTQSGLITKIDFWASWYGDEPPGMNPNNVAFVLSLHSDVPAGVDQDWSHPDETLWMHHFAAGECTVELRTTVPIEGWFEPPAIYIDDADHEIWLYSCPIPEPDWFQQVEDTIYWLDIQAFPQGSGIFGWKTSVEHWNDDGVWATGAEPEIPPLAWQELRYPELHPQAGLSIDLAFQLWGQECDSGIDSDGDTFNDDVECYLPTDFRDDCPDIVGVHDAWPLDVNMDTFVTVVGDVLNYAGKIGATGGPPPAPNWMQRLDLNMDNFITVVGDVLNFAGHIGDQCA